MADLNNVEALVKELKQDTVSTNSTYSAIVSQIDGQGVVWVYLAGSSTETPTASTSAEVHAGDAVTVEWRNNKLYIAGNYSSPSAGVVRVANVEQVAQGAQSAATMAYEAANSAQADADRAHAAADEAEGHAQTAMTNAGIAQTAADNALVGLSNVEDVVGVLNWITAHGTMIPNESAALDPSKVYFIVDPNGDYEVSGTHYSIVGEPKAEDRTSYYTLSVDKSVQNYVATHLAVNTEGLWLIPDQNGTPSTNGKKVLIATGAGSTYSTAGTYIIDKVNGVDNVLASFSTDGASIRDGDAELARFGSVVRIGTEENANITIDNESIAGVGENGKDFFSFANSSTQLSTQYTSHIQDIVVASEFPYGSSEGIEIPLSLSPTNGSDIVVNITLRALQNGRWNPINWKGFHYTAGTSSSGNCTVEDTQAGVNYVFHVSYNGDKLFSQIKLDTQGASDRSIYISITYTATTLAPCYKLGQKLTVTGAYALAEGRNNSATGNCSHVEGASNTASGINAHAEGILNSATGDYSHAEGYYNTASGQQAHAEGALNTASSASAHAEGDHTTASEYAAHAEGGHTVASAYYSHAQGEGAIARSMSQMALGRYNVEDPNGGYFSYGDYSVILGNGTDDDHRSNAFTVDWNGNVNIASGAKYKINGNNLSASDVNAVAKTGNQTMAGSLTVQSHSSPIGTVKDAYPSSAVSVASGTAKALCSISLEAGVWILLCGVRSPANATGVRRGNVSTDSGSTVIQIQADAVTTASAVTQLQFSVVVQPSSTTTYYLNAMQNSGSTLSYPAGAAQNANYIRATRIA